jgi:SPP1 gp7 family putative phage head morphogenesis protein
MPNRSALPTPPHDVVWEPLPYEEIIARFRSRKLLTPEQAATLGQDAYRLGWSVANGTTMGILQTMRESLATHYAEGRTLQSWVKQLPQLMESTGWTAMNRGHPATIFRTTLATVFEGERYDTLTKDEFVEFLVFDAINDDRVRAEHLELDGKAWEQGNFPDEYWPPLDYNCRCTVVPATAKDLPGLGVTGIEDVLIHGVRPAPGFEGPPSMHGLAVDMEKLLPQRAQSLGFPVPATTPPEPIPARNPLPGTTFTGSAPSEARILDLDKARLSLDEWQARSPVGASVSDCLRMSGIPDGTGDLRVKFEDEARRVVRVQSRHALATQERTIVFAENGEVEIHNDYFAKRDGAPSGLGARCLSEQVAAVLDQGYTGVIETEAAGMANEDFNGYYTWPRMGYDLELDDIRHRFSRPLPSNLSGATHLSDLMATPEGRAWWKAYGFSVHATFDVRPGSPHIRRLVAYLQEKGYVVPDALTRAMD